MCVLNNSILRIRKNISRGKKKRRSKLIGANDFFSNFVFVKIKNLLLLLHESMYAIESERSCKHILFGLVDCKEQR